MRERGSERRRERRERGEREEGRAKEVGGEERAHGDGSRKHRKIENRKRKKRFPRFSEVVRERESLDFINALLLERERRECV
jgi:hypothetical protein